MVESDRHTTWCIRAPLRAVVALCAGAPLSRHPVALLLARQPERGVGCVCHKEADLIRPVLLLSQGLGLALASLTQSLPAFLTFFRKPSVSLALFACQRLCFSASFDILSLTACSSASCATPRRARSGRRRAVDWRGRGRAGRSPASR